MPPTCPLSALYLFIHLSNSCFGFLFVPSSSMLLFFCFLINWDHNTTSVTRFGEISPLWQYFKSLGQFCIVYLVFSIILILLWKIFYAIWPFFTVVNCQILNNLSSHLATLNSLIGVSIPNGPASDT